jgi:hypothetical protein
VLRSLGRHLKRRIRPRDFNDLVFSGECHFAALLAERDRGALP